MFEASGEPIDGPGNSPAASSSFATCRSVNYRFEPATRLEARVGHPCADRCLNPPALDEDSPLPPSRLAPDAHPAARQALPAPFSPSSRPREGSLDGLGPGEHGAVHDGGTPPIRCRGGNADFSAPRPPPPRRAILATARPSPAPRTAWVAPSCRDRTSRRCARIRRLRCRCPGRSR